MSAKGTANTTPPGTSLGLGVVVVLVCLILFLGVYSVERTEKTLQAFLEQNCIASAGILERITQENLNVMMQESAQEIPEKFVPFGEEVFSPEKVLIATIGEKAKEIDSLLAQKPIDTEAIARYTKENNLLMVILLDEKGRVRFQSAPLPKEFFISEGAAGMKRPYRANTSLTLLDDLAKRKLISFIALKRQNREGMLIVVLNHAGLRYWGMVVAVGKAVRDLQHGQAFEYVRVFDTEKRLLAQAGALGNHSFAKEKEDIDKIIKESVVALPQRFASGGKKVLGMMLPLTINNKQEGVISIGVAWNDAERILADNKRNVFLSVLFVIIIAVAALVIFNRNQRTHLAKRLEMEKQLEKAERLSMLGKLAAGVAHEIRNPLNAISMATQRIKRDFPPAEAEKLGAFEEITSLVKDEIRRLNGIIEEFLVFSRPRRLNLHPCSLAVLLQKLVTLLDEQAQTRDMEIHLDIREPLVAVVDADKIQQALLNIVKNAMESISGSGRIEISASQENGKALIRVSDTGRGMSAEEIEKIFNFEYTTKEKGLGLGLTLSHEIIKGHGGDIRLSSKENEGSTFEIILPLPPQGEKT